MAGPSPSDPAFWQVHYDEHRLSWDLGAAAGAWGPLVELHAIAPGRTLVLGAGRGHDALWFAERGHTVTAIDFAAGAVAATVEAARLRNVSMDVRQTDLFALTAAELGRFDVVVEHTCYCAIDPARRPEYERVVAELLRPGGHYLAVFFRDATGGPPFPTPREETRALFESDFELLRLEPNPDSPEHRVGREDRAVFRRR